MNFTAEEYLLRLNKVKKTMSEKGLDVLILSDPSNMNYLTGYDGWSFYVPQGVVVSLDNDEPIWFGRKQDSNGARITTFLKEENILGYPENLIQSPPLHPYDYVVKLFKDKIDLYEWISHLTGGFSEPYTFGERMARWAKLNYTKYDVVHDNQTLAYGLLKFKKLGVPVVGTIHHPITMDKKIDIKLKE